MMENSFSLKNVIKHDYISLLSFVCAIIMAVLLLQMYFIGFSFSRGSGLVFVPVEERFLYYCIFGGIGLIGLLCFISRINIIKGYFNSGIKVKGIISELMYWRDRGKITFIYNIEGKEYQKTIAIHTTKMTASLGKNDEIIALVRTDNHSKAIIKDIFEIKNN